MQFANFKEETKVLRKQTYAPYLDMKRKNKKEEKLKNKFVDQTRYTLLLTLFIFLANAKQEDV